MGQAGKSVNPGRRAINSPATVCSAQFSGITLQSTIRRVSLTQACSLYPLANPPGTRPRLASRSLLTGLHRQCLAVDDRRRRTQMSTGQFIVNLLIDSFAAFGFDAPG